MTRAFRQTRAYSLSILGAGSTAGAATSSDLEKMQALVDEVRSSAGAASHAAVSSASEAAGRAVAMARRQRVRLRPPRLP